jgi:hypothetical protein
MLGFELTSTRSSTSHSAATTLVDLPGVVIIRSVAPRRALPLVTNMLHGIPQPLTMCTSWSTRSRRTTETHRCWQPVRSITELSDVELPLSHGYTRREYFRTFVTVRLDGRIAKRGSSVAIGLLQPSCFGITKKVTYFPLSYCDFSFYFFGSLYHRWVNELCNTVIGR